MNVPSRVEAFGLVATKTLGYWDFYTAPGIYASCGWLPRSMGGNGEDGLDGLMAQMKAQAARLQEETK